MTRRTCALCGERDAATLTDYDGRQVPACTRCLAPVADPPEPVDDLIAAIGTGERTFAEIARWLGVEDLDRTGLAGALQYAAIHSSPTLAGIEAQRRAIERICREAGELRARARARHATATAAQGGAA